MPNKLYEESSVQAIADAIRGKNGTTTTYKIGEMAAAIQALQTGGGGGANNVSYGTYTATNGFSNKVEHALGATPAALLFVYVGLTTDITAKYDDALVAHIIPNKNSVSYIWELNKARFRSVTLSANETSQLWSTGEINSYYDRVNYINDQYFYTPTNCDTGTYFWAVFKEALI